MIAKLQSLPFWEISPPMFSLIGVICILAFIVSIPFPRVDNSLLGSDGLWQYFYLRSMVLDRDIVFNNEYIHYMGQGTFVPRKDWSLDYFLRGPDIVGNPWPVGSAVIWLPAFLLAHLATVVANAIGFAVQANGYTMPYEIAVTVENILLGYLGILLTLRFTWGYAEQDEIYRRIKEMLLHRPAYHYKATVQLYTRR